MPPSSPKPLSREQQNFLDNSVYPINICDGPVRAGKNYVENIRVKTYLKTEPYGATDSWFLFAGSSKGSVVRNYLQDLFGSIPRSSYTYNSQSGMGRIFGRPFFVAGFDDAAAFKTIQGMTLGGALVTEAQLAHESFIDTLIARVSVEDALQFWDCNPVGPQHFLYEKYVGNTEAQALGQIGRFRFNFDSNLSLGWRYKENLKARYVPGSLLYQRMIEGLWVAADGIIYTAFNSDANVISPELIPVGKNIWVPYDFGIQHPTVFGKLIQHEGIFYLAAEKFHHGEVEGRKSSGQYIKDLKEFIAPFNARPAIIQDPAPVSAAFNVDIEKHFDGYDIQLADNSVLKGINTVQYLLSERKLLISSDCKQTIKGFGSYIWDKRAANKGDDIPLKENDDAMCMLRYGCHTISESYDSYAGYGD